MTRMLSTLLQQNYGPYGNASSTGTATLPKKPPMSAYQVLSNGRGFYFTLFLRTKQHLVFIFLEFLDFFLSFS